MSRVFYSNPSLVYRCWRCGRVSSGVTRRHSTSTEQPFSPPIKRLSPINIQMLSEPLHKQIFHTEPETSPDAVSSAIQHLSTHGLWGSKGSSLPDIDVQLPPLQGENIDEHFRFIAREQSEPYLQNSLSLAKASLPPIPKSFSLEPGWTKYDGKKMVQVNYPSGDALVLDVEVCVPESPRPILAAAVSESHWFTWVSRRLVSGEDYYSYMQRRTVAEDLIPLESRDGSVGPVSGQWKQRVVVGHNVSYDRARVKEQYLIKGPRTKFLDTLSLHTCVAGQTTHQRGRWLAESKAARENKSKLETWLKEAARGDGRRGERQSKEWLCVSSPSGLAEVHWLYVARKRGEKMISKEKRDVFVKGNVHEIRKNFQSLMKYCVQDVKCTHEVLQKVLPLFLLRCPHPVTFAGMLEMGSAYLPVDSSWNHYIADTEYTYEDMEREMKAKLMALADQACSYMHNERYLTSPWLCNLDWSSKKFRGKAIKTKKAMKELLGGIEGEFTERERVFLAADESDDAEMERKNKFVITSEEPLLPTRPVHMPGYPEWYRSLCMRRTASDWRPGCVGISAQTRVAPYLLRMKWKGNPLHYHATMGWGYVVAMEPGNSPNACDDETSVNIGMQPYHEDSTTTTIEQMMDEYRYELYYQTWNKATSLDEEHSNDSTMLEDPTNQNKDAPNGRGLEKVQWNSDSQYSDIVTLPNGEKYYFYKLPHKDGSEANCGNPLSKDFLPKMEDGTLTSEAGHMGHRILKLNSMMSFWRSARSRVLQQFVVWRSGEGHSNRTEAHSDCGAILPVVRVAATATRRAVEPTWLTASNAKETRVGSELKAMVRAPPGYHLVGADVDSQELWIAAVLGDMHFAGLHGSTAVGWMILQGSKAEGTDVHSKTADTIGISRDHAKILNYGRIYGAGLPFMELLLQKFNPNLTAREVSEKAHTLYSSTKGSRMYMLAEEGVRLAQEVGMDVREGAFVSQEDWNVLRNELGYDLSSRLLLKREWVGGSESHMFNKLESIALSDLPRTPVLGCCIPTSLEKRYVGNSYHTSKINWVVQSSAVDYLHLMLVCARWLFDLYDIDGRFCISIHDEVRYLVKSEDRYRAALALHFTNLLTRSMFAHQLKMDDLPQSVAFFSAVDVDKVLRKEAAMDCKTPSNPLGLEQGHGIPRGESLDIYDVLQKTNSTLEKS